MTKPRNKRKANTRKRAKPRNQQASLFLKPMGPTFASRFRFFKTASFNTAGPPPFVTFCENIGSDITGLTDFTDEAAVWDRFVITSATIVAYILK